MKAVEGSDQSALAAGGLREANLSAPSNGPRFWFKTVSILLPAAVFLGLMPCYHLFEVWGWVGGWDGLAWLSAGAMAGVVCIVATVLAVILAVINH